MALDPGVSKFDLDASRRGEKEPGAIVVGVKRERDIAVG
jgi:hypothetical protein